MNKPKLTIVKIGGNIVDFPTALNQFLNDFHLIEGNKILVHGGGKIASELSKSMGIEPIMIEGRRVTDSETLKIVTMVYGGLINKNITAQLQALQTNAIGITGADGKIILSHKRKHPSIDFGYVGDIDKVDNTKIIALLNAGFVPIFAPLTIDINGQILNTNADTIASSLAIALSQDFQVQFVYCFEKKGLLKNIHDENSFIPHIQIGQIQNLINEGTIVAGMIPKVHNIELAIQKGVQQVRLCHASDIFQIIQNHQPLGTLFTI
ncbi:MAG: acetylglutamate kinase [Chitinophagales bacterium]|nr:acetylglutamate kinase [Chitinophagales bacterium]MCZ2393549.1 acetylglutamate kinase [Chitinophagales bacterium]